METLTIEIEIRPEFRTALNQADVELVSLRRRILRLQRDGKHLDALHLAHVHMLEIHERLSAAGPIAVIRTGP